MFFRQKLKSDTNCYGIIRRNRVRVSKTLSIYSTKYTSRIILSLSTSFTEGEVERRRGRWIQRGKDGNYVKKKEFLFWDLNIDEPLAYM